MYLLHSFLVYVHIGDGEDQTNEFAATVDVRFGIFPGNRRFSILVSQLNCDDENIPPDGCLQYFRGKTGTYLLTYLWLPCENYDSSI